METKINSQRELYNRIKPALRCKKHEIKANGYSLITEKDIWDYNKENKWNKENGLTLASMVDDILNTPNDKYIEYVNNEVNKIRLQGE